MGWRDEYAALILAAAAKYALDRFLLESLIEQESGGNTWAVRYEPNYKWTVPFKHPLVSAATELQQQKTSWGLCQVMGGVAREMNYHEPFLSVLCNPVIGIDAGGRFLAKCIKEKGGKVRLGLLRYNGGGNLHYADDVLNRADKFRSGG